MQARWEPGWLHDLGALHPPAPVPVAAHRCWCHWFLQKSRVQLGKHGEATGSAVGLKASSRLSRPPGSLAGLPMKALSMPLNVDSMVLAGGVCTRAEVAPVPRLRAASYFTTTTHTHRLYKLLAFRRGLLQGQTGQNVRGQNRHEGTPTTPCSDEAATTSRARLSCKRCICVSSARALCPALPQPPHSRSHSLRHAGLT